MDSSGEEREYLSAVQLGRLLPILPAVFALLKELDGRAADLFLEGEETERVVVEYLMAELLNNLNFNGDLSMRELRFSFASYKVSVWIALTRIVLTQCWPRIIPDKVAMELLGSLTSLNEAQTPIDCAHVLGPLLDKIPRTRFRVLAEFCSFLRDSSMSAEDLACLVGPFLLLPSSVLTSQGTSLIASQTAASAAITDLLIQEAELLFGRVAVAAPYGHPLGVRPKKGKAGGGKMRTSLTNGLRRLSLRGGAKGDGAAGGRPTGRGGRTPPPAPPRKGVAGRGAPPASPGGAAASKATALLEKRKKQLRVFYQWRDPTRTDRVDVLFDNYSFEEIALAIQRKYYLLPPRWKDQLEYMLLTGNKSLGWFARLKQGILPAPVESGQQFMVTSADSQELTKIDKVVNEIADTENTFNQTLKELQERYVNRIKTIAEGYQGANAQKALGLTTTQVDVVFGARLQRVIDVSSNLLSDLEVVTLVRRQPTGGKSRIELVSRVFAESARQLSVFAPFAVAHKSAVTVLREAKNSLPEGSGALRRMGSLLGGERPKNFREIWEEASGQSDVLRGQTLESILIMPVQRVPRYRLLLQELRKATPETDEAYILLDEALQVVKGLATEINEAIRTHERLMKKFGDDPGIPIGM